MRNLAIAAGIILVAGLVGSPVVKADSTTIAATQVTVTGPGGAAGNLLGVADGSNSPSGSGTGTSYTSTGFDSGSGFGSSTYGSFTVTITAATNGTYYVGGFFDPELDQDFYNEYASVNGTAAVGQTWQVGDPNSSGLNPFGANNTLNNALTNTNGIPGTAANLGPTPCTAANCNGDVSVGMGFSESLVAGDVETVTFTISTSAPTSGFYIEQIHPVDGSQGNTSPVRAFLSATESVQAPCVTGAPGCGGGGGGGTGVPEPSSLMLLGTSLVGLLGFLKKLSN